MSQHGRVFVQLRIIHVYVCVFGNGSNVSCVDMDVLIYIEVNAKRYISHMMGQRRRPWANVKTALSQYLMFLSESFSNLPDAFRRQILTSKDGPLAKRAKTCRHFRYKLISWCIQMIALGG